MAYVKKVTMKDIAKAAGVSQSTVSMIFAEKNDYKFSTETVERVKSLASAMGYIVKKEKKVSEIPSKVIVAVCPSMTNPYYTMVLEAIQISCIAKGYNLFTYSTSRSYEEEVRLLDLLSEMSVAGVIYSYFSSSIDVIKKIAEKVPMVLIGDRDERLDVDAVELNSAKSGRLIANHLLSLGHKKIAFISTFISDQYFARGRRLKGMQNCFEEAGIKDGVILKTYDAGKNLKINNIYNEYSVGYDLTKEVLQDNPDVTAIAGLNDMFAMGIMDALLDANYTVPQDYSVIGCDNTIVGGLRKISLTTVEHYVTAKGQQAVELLLKKIQLADIEEDSPSSIMRVEYEPHLIVRESTGVCRNQKRNER